MSNDNALDQANNSGLAGLLDDLFTAIRAAHNKALSTDLMALDEQGRCEALRWSMTVAQVAFDTFVYSDPLAPRWVDIVGPYKKWGGDNADAYYQYFAPSPQHTYRIWGNRGDAVYLSMTLYGGPSDGRWSDRIIGIVNDQTLNVDEEGNFEFFVGPAPLPGPGIISEPDAVAAITRDYQADAPRGRRAEFHVECLDPQPSGSHFRENEVELARRLRSAINWVKDQTSIVPVLPDEVNRVQDPYPVPTTTFGWAAGDAAYALGRFDLRPDESLLLTGRSPECRFWNVCLWNPLLHTYNYDHDRSTLNSHQCTYEDDGSWEIVVAQHLGDHPNSISTQGHSQGLIWFRWFYPESTPNPISATLIKINGSI